MSAVGDIQTIINDAGVFWPTQTVWDALNEAQLSVYAETKWALTTQTFSLSSNVDIVEIPSNILVPRWIEGTNSLFQPAVVKRFFPSSMRNLEHFLRTWRGDNTGQPVYFILWDATHWRVFPRPDGSGSGPGGVYPFTVFGVGFPPEITDSTSTLLGDATYRYAVYNYTAALLLEATRPDLADMYLAQAQDNMLTIKKRLRNQQSHNIRTLKPATGRLEIEQGGQISELPSYYPVEC
jgi:hypothetical protein